VDRGRVQDAMYGLAGVGIVVSASSLKDWSTSNVVPSARRYS